MQIVRHIRTAVLALFSVLGLCGLTRAQAAYNTTGPLIFYDAAGNQTLDPLELQNSSSLAQGQTLAVYDALIQLDAAGNPTPGRAVSWAYNADLAEFTLKLRQGVTCHDSQAFNATAVARNLERAAALINRVGARMQMISVSIRVSKP